MGKHIVRWLKRAGLVMLFALAIPGAYHVWMFTIVMLRVTSASSASLPVDRPVDVSTVPGAMTFVILQNQLPVPSGADLIDEPYGIDMPMLISLVRPALQFQGRLKPGEVQRSRQILVAITPGEEARLYIPVATDQVAQGWRPIYLKGTHGIFAIPDSSSPPATTMLVQQDKEP